MLDKTLAVYYTKANLIKAVKERKRLEENFKRKAGWCKARFSNLNTL